jgi:hypothetical protein
MTDQRNVIRAVSWRDLFPWLILLRTFRIAILPQLLAIATAATLVGSLGWWISGWVFMNEWDEAAGRYVVRLPAVNPATRLESQLPSAVREYLPTAPTGLLDPFFRLAEPARRLFDMRLTLREAAYYLFGWLWSLGVWALAGGAITRHAVLALATEGSPGIQTTVRFAARRYPWYFLTPLYPVLGIVLIAIPIVLLGLPMRLAPGLGAILAAVLWIFVVIASLAAVWLLGGLIFGWPLMWPAISAEREGDPFEAFSRSFSYVYGRPLHYLFYVVVAALFGALCLAVVSGAAALVTEFGFWALAWGGGQDVIRLRELVDFHLIGNEPLLAAEEKRSLVFAAWIFSIFVRLIGTVVTGYSFSFFWCVASAIYLLLRHDVDDKEMDEVFLDQPLPKAPVAAAPIAAAPNPNEPVVPS